MARIFLFQFHSQVIAASVSLYSTVSAFRKLAETLEPRHIVYTVTFHILHTSTYL